MEKADFSTAVDLTIAWLIEISAYTTDEGINETTEDLNTFADYLAPYTNSPSP